MPGLLFSTRLNPRHRVQTRRAAHMDVRRFQTEPGWRVGKSPRHWIYRCAFNFERHFFGDFLRASKESYPPQAEAPCFEQEAKSLDSCFRRDDEQGLARVKAPGSPPSRG